MLGWSNKTINNKSSISKESYSMNIERMGTTVEPPFATTSRKRPPLISDHFSKIPNVFKSNHYRWDLS